MIVAVTGANGFLGQAVCRELGRRGHTVRALVRSAASASSPDAEQHRYNGLDDELGLRNGLRGADAVIHLAARVHRMRERAADQLAEYRRVNTDGTRALAAIAARVGVTEMLFASSVKAVGEWNDRAWTESDLPAPVDPYGISKLEAERALAGITAETGLATAALRLPMTYGPGVKANMYRLFALVDRGVPLPLSGLRNARSLLYVENVAVAFARLLGGVRAHELFFASDGEDISTTELIRRIATALNRPVRLLPGPPERVLRLLTASNVPVLSPVVRRLAGSLTVDSSALRNRIGPMPFTVNEGLQATAAWYTTVRRAS